MSLKEIGETSLAGGELEQARSSYQEGLAVARTLAQGLPDVPDHGTLVQAFERRLSELAPSRLPSASEVRESPPPPGS